MVDMKKFMTAIVSGKDKDVDKMLAESLEYLDRVYGEYNPRTTILTPAFGKSALSWVAYLNHGTTVENFIDLGANPNGIVPKQDPETGFWLPSDAYSPLCYACERNNVGVVHALIERGADLNIRWQGFDDLGKQAIHFAVEGDSISSARMLLEAGADPCANIEFDKFPLSMSNSIDMTRLLLEFGADVNQSGVKGEDTALMRAVVGGSRNNNSRGVKELIKLGADVNFVSKTHKETPLHCASIYTNVEIVKALLDAGADRTAVDAKGETPYDAAVRKNKSEEIIRLLKV